MASYLLSATPEDMLLLAEILREARQKPWEFHNCDREEKIIELEKKWLIPSRQKALGEPCISPKAEEKLNGEWYLCDADLHMELDGKIAFKKGFRYKRVQDLKGVWLIDEQQQEHLVDFNEETSSWLKHFTLITESNQLRVEVEDGREPSEIQLNQTIKS